MATRQSASSAWLLMPSQRSFRKVSLPLVFSLILTSSAPAFALKQTQTQEAGVEQELKQEFIKLANAAGFQLPDQPSTARPDVRPELVEGRAVPIAAGAEETEPGLDSGVVTNRLREREPSWVNIAERQPDGKQVTRPDLQLHLGKRGLSIIEQFRVLVGRKVWSKVTRFDLTFRKTETSETYAELVAVLPAAQPAAVSAEPAIPLEMKQAPSQPPPEKPGAYPILQVFPEVSVWANDSGRELHDRSLADLADRALEALKGCQSAGSTNNSKTQIMLSSDVVEAVLFLRWLFDGGKGDIASLRMQTAEALARQAALSNQVRVSADREIWVYRQQSLSSLRDLVMEIEKRLPLAGFKTPWSVSPRKDPWLKLTAGAEETALVERAITYDQLGIPSRQDGRTLTVVPVSADKQLFAMQLHVQAGLEEAQGVATVEAPVREATWAKGAPLTPLKLIFRPENAGLALLVPKEGVKARIIVADAEQSEVIESYRPDLAGSFISIEDVGSLGRALALAREDLGPEAREVTEILSRATLAQRVKLWLRQFPWIAPILDDALLRDIELGTQL